MEAVREIFEAGEAYWIDLGTRVLKGVQNHTLTLIDQSFFEDLLVCRATYLQNPISLMDWYLPAFRRTTDCLEGADPVAGLDGYLVITNTLRMAMSGTYDTPSYSGKLNTYPLRPFTNSSQGILPRIPDQPLKEIQDPATPP
jgi:hypothetical protein